MEDLAGPRLCGCYQCQNHVCCHRDIVSKASQASRGRAFLFSRAMNVVVGPTEDRYLITGLHTVADVHCCDCKEVLGWKFVKAYQELQKYKDGKFVLAKFNIVKVNW